MASRIKSKVGSWEARYGRKGMVALVLATLVLAPLPIPGTCLLPVAVAELVLRIRG